MGTKEKIIDVDLENGEKVKLLIKKPSSQLLSKAQKLGAKVWTESVKEGLFTKLTLQEFMRNQGIWDDQKESRQASITANIQRLEREIALGVNGKKLKVSEGKSKALELRRLRNQLRDLISERISLEGNTAEGLSDNAKFNYLVACCTYYDNGEKVYKNLEDYEEKSDDELAFAAASALGEIIYNLDKSYEESLPENQFLKKFKLVNDDLALVDSNGNRVDVDGTRVNDKGWLVNAEGQRIDRDGNLLSDSGQILLQAEYEDDINPPEPKKVKKQTTESPTGTIEEEIQEEESTEEDN
jgi:hypothetical protein